MQLAENPVPAVLLVAHGSPDPRHRAAMELLTEQVRRRRGSPVSLGFLDHNDATVADAAAALHDPPEGIVGVSLLLARGFHARFDAPRLLADNGVVDAGPVGLHGPVVRAVHQTLAAVQADAQDPHLVVLLASAGSAQPQAQADYATFRATVQAQARATIRVVPLTSGEHALTAELDAATSAGRNVAVVPLLLAPGVMSDRVHTAVGRGADPGRVKVTQVLGAAPAIVDAVVERATTESLMPRSTRARTASRR